MNILMPYIFKDSLTSGVMIGGVEKFMRGIMASYPNVKTVLVPATATPKEARTAVLDAIAKHKIDIVLANYQRGSISTALSRYTDVPVMVINHYMPYGISAVGQVQNMAKHEKNGSVWFVSGYQYDRWKRVAKNAGVRLQPQKLVPFFVEEKNEVTPLRNCIYDCATIGKAAPKPYKDPFLLHRWLEDSKLSALVMTNRIPKEYAKKEENEYATFNDNWRPPHHTAWNLPHHKVMERMAKAKTFFIPWTQETFGIIALEALSYGIPIIINGRHDHACAAIPQSDEQYRMVHSASGLQEAIEELRELPDKVRKRIRDMTWDKYKMPVWKKALTACMEKAMKP